MGFWSTLAKVGGLAAAPFTGGTSAIPALIGAGSAVAGNILSNTAGARTQSTAIPGQYQSLADLLRGRVEDRLRTSADLSGYQSQGLQDINRTFANIGQGVTNNLTARGLSTSPVAGAVAGNLAAARGGQMAQFLNSIPLLQRQLQAQDIGLAQSTLNPMLGRTAPGSALGAGLSSVPEVLAYLKSAGVLGGAGGGSGDLTTFGGFGY